MRVRVLYFAKLREHVGVAEEEVSLAETTPTVADLLTHLRARGGHWATALSADAAVKCAVHKRLSAFDAPLNEGAEVAFFPPLTGG